MIELYIVPFLSDRYDLSVLGEDCVELLGSCIFSCKGFVFLGCRHSGSGSPPTNFRQHPSTFKWEYAAASVFFLLFENRILFIIEIDRGL